MKTPFTKADGIAVQTDQIARWATVLKPEVLALVKAEAERQNADPYTTNGHDVWRGDTIGRFIENIACRMYLNPRPHAHIRPSALM